MLYRVQSEQDLNSQRYNNTATYMYHTVMTKTALFSMEYESIYQYLT